MVGIGKTSRREEKQVSQVRDKSEFFKPLAKRKKMESEGDLKPGLQEMESRDSLKVPGQLENFLGVDFRSIGLVQGGNKDYMHPKLTHVTPRIENSEGEIDPTSPEAEL